MEIPDIFKKVVYSKFLEHLSICISECIHVNETVRLKKNKNKIK